MLAVFCTGCAGSGLSSSRGTARGPLERPPHVVDQVRVHELEHLKVGDLGTASNLCDYLVWFNEKLSRSRVAPRCSLGLKTTEYTVQLRQIMGQDRIKVDAFTKPLFEDLGVSVDGADARRVVSEMNMREFLWILVGAYRLAVRYEKRFIEVGYGWSWDHYVTPWDVDPWVGAAPVGAPP